MFKSLANVIKNFLAVPVPDVTVSIVIEDTPYLTVVDFPVSETLHVKITHIFHYISGNNKIISGYLYDKVWLFKGINQSSRMNVQRGSTPFPRCYLFALKIYPVFIACPDSSNIPVAFDFQVANFRIVRTDELG
jgi:hypothetical protein